MDMNGSAHPAFTQMQAMQQFEKFAKAAMNQALQALAPGYKATMLFTLKGKPQRDIIISSAALPDVLAALVEKMRAHGVPMPANVQTQPSAPANDQQSPDLHLAVINVVSAIRRVAPLLGGFAENHPATVAQRALLAAITADGVSETARRVVAGYLSTMPGLLDRHPEEVDKMLAEAEGGAALVVRTAGRVVAPDTPQ